MKLKLSFISEKNVILPMSYNHLLQALIYNLLDRNFAAWLHEKGFHYENRSFKLFCFSRILEKANMDRSNKAFIFPSQISFVLSSPVEQILEQFARNSVSRERFRLGNNELGLHAVEILPQPSITEEKIRIETMSPIEVHSTLEKKDGGKKTYYYAPSEREFSELINANLQKKWHALYREDCREELAIYPVRKEFLKKSILKYKDFVVQGWSGHFWLEGKPLFLRFALDAGIGSKNSQGFGSCERVMAR